MVKVIKPSTFWVRKMKNLNLGWTATQIQILLEDWRFVFSESAEVEKIKLLIKLSKYANSNLLEEQLEFLGYNLGDTTDKRRDGLYKAHSDQTKNLLGVIDLAVRTAKFNQKNERKELFIQTSLVAAVLGIIAGGAFLVKNSFDTLKAGESDRVVLQSSVRDFQSQRDEDNVTLKDGTRVSITLTGEVTKIGKTPKVKKQFLTVRTDRPANLQFLLRSVNPEFPDKVLVVLIPDDTFVASQEIPTNVYEVQLQTP